MSATGRACEAGVLTTRELGRGTSQALRPRELGQARWASRPRKGKRGGMGLPGEGTGHGTDWAVSSGSAWEWAERDEREGWADLGLGWGKGKGKARREGGVGLGFPMGWVVLGLG